MTRQIRSVLSLKSGISSAPDILFRSAVLVLGSDDNGCKARRGKGKGRVKEGGKEGEKGFIVARARGEASPLHGTGAEVLWPDRPQTSHTLVRADGVKEEEGKSVERGMLMDMKGVEAEDWEEGEREAIGHIGEVNG